MAARETVHQLANSDNSSALTTRLITPRNGVVTHFGYGITVQVDRGHLIFRDGIGTTRREARFSRVGHGIRRLVVIGSDGMVSLAALRWLADQDAAFVMLDRDGSVLATTGPVRPSDARLQRAQSLAYQSGMAVRIARELISRKLAEQEQLVRNKLRDSLAADAIASAHSKVKTAETIPSIRQLESQAAYAYCLHGAVFLLLSQRTIFDGYRNTGVALELGKSTFLQVVGYGMTGVVPKPGGKFSSVDDYYRDMRAFTRDYFDGRWFPEHRDIAEIELEMSVGDKRITITRGFVESESLRSLKVVSGAKPKGPHRAFEIYHTTSNKPKTAWLIFKVCSSGRGRTGMIADL